MLAGFVLPFWLIVGEFIAAMISQLVVAPQLVHRGLLPHWHPGMNVIQTSIAASVDFWMSVGIGAAIVVAVIGLANIAKSALGGRNRRAGGTGVAPRTPPPGRGDWSIPLSVGVWAFGTFCYIGICHYLVPNFPVGLLIFYGLVWTPLNSYISARMFGLTGRGVGFPYLREASFVLSGYRGVDIWFAPIPLADYGGNAQFFRSVELTGTKFTSILKAEVMIVPIILAFSFIFWAYFWHMGEIPSALYPYANRMWPIQSIYAALWPTATLTPESNWLLKAIKWDVIGGTAACGFGLYGIVTLLKLPQMLFYGLVTGMGMQTTSIVPMFIGAMLGRFYFAKRFGSRWGAYTPVLMAGYSCGMGLVGMAGVALGMIASTSHLPYHRLPRAGRYESSPPLLLLFSGGRIEPRAMLSDRWPDEERLSRRAQSEARVGTERPSRSLRAGSFLWVGRSRALPGNQAACGAGGQVSNASAPPRQRDADVLVGLR